MTSEKELERYKRIEDVARALLDGKKENKPWDWTELEAALKPLHTPLVSDEEIRKVWTKSHRISDTSLMSDKEEAYARNIGALYLRKMLDDLRQYALDNKEQGCAVAAWVSNRMCERWEEAEATNDK